jgi:peptidoglycan-N-acetylglucosamine deacetylase
MSAGLPHLTFDDGPSPRTDQLLDVLARYDVRATFFVIGARIAERAATVRRAADEGHAIGNHAWVHPSLPDAGRGSGPRPARAYQRGDR